MPKAAAELTLVWTSPRDLGQGSIFNLIAQSIPKSRVSTLCDREAFGFSNPPRFHMSGLFSYPFISAGKLANSHLL